MKLFQVEAKYEVAGNLSMTQSCLIVAESLEEVVPKATNWLSSNKDIRTRCSTITSIKLIAPTKEIDFEA